MRWIFQLTEFFPLHYGPGVGSASQQKLLPGIFLGVKSGRRVELTTLPQSVSRLSENVGASTSRNPKGLHGLYRDSITLSYQIFT
jgi:hypothetical protein